MNRPFDFQVYWNNRAIEFPVEFSRISAIDLRDFMARNRIPMDFTLRFKDRTFKNINSFMSVLSEPVTVGTDYVPTVMRTLNPDRVPQELRKKINVYQLPDKMVYEVGEPFDSTGIIVTLTLPGMPDIDVEPTILDPIMYQFSPPVPDMSVARELTITVLLTSDTSVRTTFTILITEPT